MPQYKSNAVYHFNYSYYRCPDCDGEFSTVSYKNGKPVCPFCGRVMEGM